MSCERYSRAVLGQIGLEGSAADQVEVLFVCVAAGCINKHPEAVPQIGRSEWPVLVPVSVVPATVEEEGGKKVPSVAASLAD